VHAQSPALAFAALVSLAACETTTPSQDADLDAGADAASEDARLLLDTARRDAGFVRETIAPCELDTSAALDATELVLYVPPAEAAAIVRREATALAILDEAGSFEALEPTTSARRAGLMTAAACSGEVSCVRDALRWSEGDATAAANVVADASDVTALASRLRGAGVCARGDTGDDRALVLACVSDTLLQVSAMIDGRSLAELDAAAIAAVVSEVQADAASLPFWGPALEVATRGLLAAGRDEAVRYEPLDEENAPALARLATIDFAAYPFTAIVVPGQGPDDDVTPLHVAGRNRANLGYERLVAGLAPVILVTGGHVHPDRTVFSEAIEMRRFLVEERGLDPAMVLVDPYARHTTTNLRNATRILVRAGVPTDRPVLVTSDILQSAYIASPAFATRCDDELGYRPFDQLTSLSDNDACFLFAGESFHVDARDPLDP
jgi:hypothetical protein